MIIEVSYGFFCCCLFIVIRFLRWQVPGKSQLISYAKRSSLDILKKLKGDLRRVFTTVSFHDLAGVCSMQNFQASFSSTVDGRNPAPPGM